MRDAQSVRYRWCILPTASRWLCLGVSLGIAAFVPARAAEPDRNAGAVFEGPIAAYEDVPPVESAPAGADTKDVLRWIWVEERMNVARHDAPVRVPVFFAAGECHGPDELAIVRWPSREAVEIQADDIRRGPDGGLARLHLWFTANL